MKQDLSYNLANCLTRNLNQNPLLDTSVIVIKECAKTHVVRHGNVKYIQNRSTVTNPTMDSRAT